MIRLFDIFFSLVCIIFLMPFFFLILFIGFLDTGSPLFYQTRVGLNLKRFVLIKFRTMKLNTKSEGTHLVDKSAITSFGYLLRITKLDELPQLWNVLKGDMSLVGPRPCLANQKKLIIERQKRGVFKVTPGITGLAQIKGIDMSRPTLLAKIDSEMIGKMNFFYYFYYVLITPILIFKK
jgi:O-antigen biosynthesis protein WbqP